MTTATPVEEQLELLIQQLRHDGDVHVRRNCARALGRLRVGQDECVRALSVALQDHDTGVRSIATQSLGDLGPAAGKAVDQLVVALDDESGVVRFGAATALGKIGAQASRAVPRLVKMLSRGANELDYSLHSDSIDVIRFSVSYGERRAAAIALGRIGVGDEIVRQALLEVVRRGDGGIVLKAIAALDSVMTDRAAFVEVIVPVLIQALQSKRGDTRYWAARSLEELGTDAIIAAPELQECTADSDGEVRVQAARAYAVVADDAIEVVPILTKELGNPMRGIRYAAARALGELGADAESSLPALADLLSREGDWGVRHTAVEAIQKIRGINSAPAN